MNMINEPTPEHQAWLAARCGYLTASHAYDACARLKNGAKGMAYRNLVTQIFTERVTHTVKETPPTAAMQWGKDHEEMAAQAFEAATGYMVTGDGETFMRHPAIAWLGASPDRFLGADGLIEIKCPNSDTHLDRFLSKKIPEQYQLQMQVQLAVTGRAYCWFVDFDPRLIGTEYEKAALLTIKYAPQQAEIDNTLKLCEEFLADVQARCNELADACRNI